MKHNLNQTGSAATTGSDPDELKRAIVAFVSRASTEISPPDERLLDELARRLPLRTPLYVAHTPKSSVEDVVRVAIGVQSAGFVASPHIVARRLPSERVLREVLVRLREHGIEQALLVAGDLERPLGPFSSTLDVIATGALEASGLKRLGIAGHPEGHPSVGPAALLSALRAKQEFAARSGIAMHIVTQFGFNPQAVCAWARSMTREGITLPVHVGLAGPTSPARLLPVPMRCCSVCSGSAPRAKPRASCSRMCIPSAAPSRPPSG
jgi:methylenetetrahydrofolate reductase (NADPH)